MWGFFVVLYVIVTLVAAIVLNIFAKSIGRIKDAKFIGSVLVAITGQLIVMVLYLILGAVAEGSPMEFLRLFNQIGMFGSLVINIIVLVIAYVPMGKIFWKTTWGRSIAANAVWIGLYAVIVGALLTRVESMI